MAEDGKIQRIRFDLPEYIVRAIKARAALDGADPRDVVMRALDGYLQRELAMARQSLANPDQKSAPAEPRRKRGKPS